MLWKCLQAQEERASERWRLEAFEQPERPKTECCAFDTNGKHFPSDGIQAGH